MHISGTLMGVVIIDPKKGVFIVEREVMIEWIIYFGDHVLINWYIRRVGVIQAFDNKNLGSFITAHTNFLGQLDNNRA